ncbi:LysM peptidoglycan-binding domain-containing protein [Adhaeribacter aquaticus]|uniref:LysM peptidoglycan-binding domain-containing protein n=1 Tax=Adhaeribacter aquaticus TaxID=299567 RepID=UPI0012F9D0E0|nr:LysM domain-containing protein [Adhaeribacter aquaticus]
MKKNRMNWFLHGFLLIFFFTATSWAQVPASGPGYHLVVKGDTYYQLAKRYQIPLDSLFAWNGKALQIGSVIRVVTNTSPSAATDPEPATTEEAFLADQVPTSVPEPQPATPVTTQTTAKYAKANKQAQRILIIPFDPHLYFSDADNDIALQSKIPRQHIRYIFRSQLNAYLKPEGYENINLIGGAFHDSTAEAAKIYKSLSYNYQRVTKSKFYTDPLPQKTATNNWLQKQKEKLKAASGTPKSPAVSQDDSKYYGVQVKDSSLYTYFNTQYAVDYYLFINQFEIHTDYTSCLDRVTKNFVRDFVVHYTILTNEGEIIAGNKLRIPYVSNINDINRIVWDNLTKMAQRIMQDLPRPQSVSTTALSN